MAIKRVLTHVERAIKILGSDEIDIKTGNPYADMVIDKMQDVSDKILQKTHNILFNKKQKSHGIR